MGHAAHLLANAAAGMIVYIICKGQAPMAGCGPETPVLVPKNGEMIRARSFCSGMMCMVAEFIHLCVECIIHFN